MRIWTNRYRQDLQRYNLALRMLSHEARTHTIAEWTGLPYSRVRRLCCSYAKEHATIQAVRHRGPSPHSVFNVLTSRRWRAEAAALVGVCYMLEVFPQKTLRNVRKELPNPGRGERLCSAYEMYRAVLPQSDLSFEQVVLLVISVAQGTEIRVNRCESCGAVILSDRYGIGQWHCTHCDGVSDSDTYHADMSGTDVLPLAGIPVSPRYRSAVPASVRRTRKQTH